MADLSSPLVRTRRSLHAVAEHILGAALHASTGHIGLRATPGGFGTPPFEGTKGPCQLRVDGTDLVVSDREGERRARLATLRAAADLAGVAPGAPADVYTPATPLDLDRPLDIERDAARALADFFATVDAALVRLPGGPSGDTAGGPQLWPEHFDLAITVDEVNYGGSPGDDEHPLPYLYVGPWNLPTDGDPFWNEPFGASTTVGGDIDTDTALEFFTAGRSRLAP
jgi:hypothetical protein